MVDPTHKVGSVDTGIGEAPFPTYAVSVNTHAVSRRQMYPAPLPQGTSRFPKRGPANYRQMVVGL